MMYNSISSAVGRMSLHHTFNNTDNHFSVWNFFFMFTAFRITFMMCRVAKAYI